MSGWDVALALPSMSASDWELTEHHHRLLHCREPGRLHSKTQEAFRKQQPLPMQKAIGRQGRPSPRSPRLSKSNAITAVGREYSRHLQPPMPQARRPGQILWDPVYHWLRRARKQRGRSRCWRPPASNGCPIESREFPTLSAAIGKQPCPRVSATKSPPLSVVQATRFFTRRQYNRNSKFR